MEVREKNPIEPGVGRGVTLQWNLKRKKEQSYLKQRNYGSKALRTLRDLRKDKNVSNRLAAALIPGAVPLVVRKAIGMQGIKEPVNEVSG